MAVTPLSVVHPVIQTVPDQTGAKIFLISCIIASTKTENHIGPAAINLSLPVMRLGMHYESRVFRTCFAASSCRHAVVFVHLIPAFRLHALVVVCASYSQSSGYHHHPHY